MGALVGLQGAAAFGAFDKDLPPPPANRSLYGEAEETLRTQEGLLPRQFAYDRDALQMYYPLISNLYANVAEQGAEEDFGLIDAYAPRTRQALRAYNPAAAGALDRLSAFDAEQMDADMNLTPFEQRQIEQGLRSGLTARGLSTGGGDAAREALNAYAGGNQLRQQRRGNVLQSAAGQQAFYGDPFQRVLGTDGATRGVQAIGSTLARSPQATLFEPYAADLHNTNYNAQWGFRFNEENKNAARNASIGNFAASQLESLTNLAGGAAGMI